MSEFPCGLPYAWIAWACAWDILSQSLPEACVGKAVGVFFVEALSFGIFMVAETRSASISDLSSLNSAMIRKSCSTQRGEPKRVIVVTYQTLSLHTPKRVRVMFQSQPGFFTFASDLLSASPPCRQLASIKAKTESWLRSSSATNSRSRPGDVAMSRFSWSERMGSLAASLEGVMSEPIYHQ